MELTREAFGAAYERGFNLTVRFLMSRGVPGDEARESAQAAWARGWERRAQLHEEGSIVHWINTIALNLYRSALRKKPLELSPEYWTEKIEMNLAALDVARILDACRPRDRRLLQAHILGVTDRELATREEVTTTSIRLRMLRARRAASAFVRGKPKRMRLLQAQVAAAEAA